MSSSSLLLLSNCQKKFCTNVAYKLSWLLAVVTKPLTGWPREARLRRGSDGWRRWAPPAATRGTSRCWSCWWRPGTCGHALAECCRLARKTTPPASTHTAYIETNATRSRFIRHSFLSLSPWTIIIIIIIIIITLFLSYDKTAAQQCRIKWL